MRFGIYLSHSQSTEVVLLKKLGENKVSIYMFVPVVVHVRVVAVVLRTAPIVAVQACVVERTVVVVPVACGRQENIQT